MNFVSENDHVSLEDTDLCTHFFLFANKALHGCGVGGGYKKYDPILQVKNHHNIFFVLMK